MIGLAHFVVVVFVFAAVYPHIRAIGEKNRSRDVNNANVLALEYQQRAIASNTAVCRTQQRRETDRERKKKESMHLITMFSACQSCLMFTVVHFNSIYRVETCNAQT